ncbi:hypothetical protein A2U01_0054399 [Trifolium medium]|uniref:Uncharacterized protein n=1 Tax=Trifolium medium TaxID=97028 RepID=A0A392R9A1_9FABA|nr:hypothetical protein [Trifolium medium]
MVVREVEEDEVQGRRGFSVARVTNEEQTVLGFKSRSHAELTLFHAGRNRQRSIPH